MQEGVPWFSRFSRTPSRLQNAFPGACDIATGRPRFDPVCPPAVPTRHRPLFFDYTVDPLDGHVETRGPGRPPATESCQ